MDITEGENPADMANTLVNSGVHVEYVKIPFFSLKNHLNEGKLMVTNLPDSANELWSVLAEMPHLRCLHLPRFPIPQMAETDFVLKMLMLESLKEFQLNLVDKEALQFFARLDSPMEVVKKLKILKLDQVNMEFMEIYQNLEFDWTVEDATVYVDSKTPISLTRQFLQAISVSLKTLTLCFIKEDEFKDQRFELASVDDDHSHLPISLSQLKSLSLFNYQDKKNSSLAMYRALITALRFHNLSTLKLECSSLGHVGDNQFQYHVQEQQRYFPVQSQSLVHLSVKSKDDSILALSPSTIWPNLKSVTMTNPSPLVMSNFLLKLSANLETLKLFWDKDNDVKVDLNELLIGEECSASSAKKPKKSPVSKFAKLQKELQVLREEMAMKRKKFSSSASTSTKVNETNFNLIQKLRGLKVFMIRARESKYPVRLTDAIVNKGLIYLPLLKSVTILDIRISKKAVKDLREKIGNGVNIRYRGRKKGQPQPGDEVNYEYRALYRKFVLGRGRKQWECRHDDESDFSDFSYEDSDSSEFNYYKYPSFSTSKTQNVGIGIPQKDDYLDFKPLLSQWTPQSGIGGRNKLSLQIKRKPTGRQVQRQRERKKSTSKVVDDDRKVRKEGKMKKKESPTDFFLKPK